ncbi:MAG: methyltransferase domain-containing protein [Pseudomonadota bacterium]
MVTGLVLIPFYLLLAAIRGVPGLRFRRLVVGTGLRLLANFRSSFPRKLAFQMVALPMDSTRYFEFDYMARIADSTRPSRYLDVSSPRMVPLSVALKRPDLHVDLINPDVEDLAITRSLIGSLGLERRISSLGCLISDAPYPAGTFDLITCISVLEHIPEDSSAIKGMWSLLKSGGALILTVPCMATAAEQHIDYDTYKLLPKDGDGFVFWQRFYDDALLQARVLDHLPPPSNVEIYGEKIAGSFFRDAQLKRRAHYYPFWRQPYMMASEYRYFDQIASLPGDGVIAMTFRKP